MFNKEEALREEMRRLGIREEDIVERFVRSAGPGGQNVNKLSTCVYLKHRPSGIEVKCQKERSQGQNRYIARRILLAKITSRKMTAESDARRKMEKLRRQKRLRPKGLKVRILENKRRQSVKKKLRGRVSQEE